MESIFTHDKDLSDLTTFGIPARARLFAEYASEKELLRISRTPAYADSNVLHIGGGSNLLFVDDFDGLILHSAIKGITSYKKDDDTVFVIAGAAERWADLVDWCVDHNLAGMENMAGIPGEVGAAPVQNVGAYGREAKDVIFSVECFDRESRKTVTIKNEDCGFAYRDSKFKKEWKSRYFVLRVSFRLQPSSRAEHLEYHPLDTLEERLQHHPSIREVRDEIIAIRDRKLPRPEEIGSAGSFFKNPVVHRNFFNDEVLRRCPDVPFHVVDDIVVNSENGPVKLLVKIPAGWLIEHAGLKGKRVGGAEVYPGNCLVIANTGGATAKDVTSLAKTVEEEVNRKFGLRLLPEVNYIDTSVIVTVLGSGTSKGIPEIGCQCRVCNSDDSRDKRLRCSVMVETMGLKIMIDASPDFRQQAIASDINRLDAVLLTHIHYDHVGGIDDLRPFCLTGDLPLYARHDVVEDLKKRLDYCFRDKKYPGVPSFDIHEIKSSPFYIQGVKITPVEVMHGSLPIIGFRIGNFAYITDCKTISDTEIDKLKGIDTLVINALRDRKHFAHLTIEESLSMIEKISPRRAYLTHLCHEAGTHEDLAKRLPPHVSPAFDGQTFIVK